MTEKRPTGRIGLVFVTMVMVYAGMSGILSNTLGVFFSAILQDTGFRAGDLSIFYMIKSLTAAGTVGITTRWFIEKDAKKVMLVLEVLLIGSFAAMALFHHLWQWYAAAVISGIGGSCFIVAVPIVINNWFIRKRGLALGITMSSSGIAGAVLSPVFSRLITIFGWRQTVLVTSAFCVAIIILPTLIGFIPSPEQVGEKPYGYGSAEAAAAAGEDRKRDRQVPASVFALAVMAVLLPGIFVSFSNQLPTYAVSVGYSLASGAMLTSYCMIGNVAGKLLMGTLSDRVGVYRAAEIFLGAVLASFAVFYGLSGSMAALSAASVLFGAEFALYVNTQPLLLLDLYGPDEYRMKMSRLQSILGIVGAFVSVIIPYVYDFTGSFRPIFLAGMAACGLSIFLFIRLSRYARSRLQDI